MTLLVRPAPAAPQTLRADRPGRRRSGRAGLRPGWPLSVLFVGFPLWWALGISEFMAMAMAVVMALELLRRRRVLTPPAFGWWLLFLAWIPVGLFLLHVDAPGAVADTSSTRYLTFVYRAIWYLTVTVGLLYVGNTREEISTRRLMRILGFMFVVVTGGGLLGVLAPTFQFTSLAEIVLPQSLANSSFVNHLVHPTAAQLQDILGYQAPRPAAPFAYTNIWGLNYACFLPFFVVAWCGRDAGWRRLAAPFILLAGAVPVVYSANRGMWGALVLVALFVALRSALMGRPGLLAGVLAGGLALVSVIALSPLGGIVQARFAGGHNSNQGRTNLATLTVTSVLSSSPVVGLGSTRNVQGNFNTITGGATADCPRCSPPALGTQGQLWLVIFCQGALGLLFYLTFFVLTMLRHIRLRSPEAGAALCVLVVGFVTMPVYNSLGVALLAIMIACGVLWREGVVASPRPEPTLEGHLSPLRRYAALVVAVTLLGAAAGGLWQKHEGVDQQAINSVLQPAAATYPLVVDGPMNIDTESNLLTTPAVLAAVSAATGAAGPVDPSRLAVTATPNTRVLHIAYIAPTAAQAVRAVDAATATYLSARRSQLLARQKTEMSTLTTRAAQLDSAVRTLDATLLRVDPPASPKITLATTATLRQKRASLITQIRGVNAQLARVTADLADPGRVTVAAVAAPRSDIYRVAVANGATLGLAFAALLSGWLYRRGRRLGHSEHLLRETGVPLLARVRTGGELPSTDLQSAVAAVELCRPVACVSADPDDDVAVDVATRLEEHVAYRRNRHANADNRLEGALTNAAAWNTGEDRPRRGDRPAVLLVSSEKARTTALTRARQRVEDSGSTVCGVVLTSASERDGVGAAKA